MSTVLRAIVEKNVMSRSLRAQVHPVELRLDDARGVAPPLLDRGHGGQLPELAGVLAAVDLGAVLGAVVLGIVDVLLAHRDRRDFPMLRRHADSSAAKRGLSPREATALGEGLARLDTTAALEAFATWSKTKGFRKLSGGGRRDLQWAAAAGLALIDDTRADKLLHALVKVEDEQIRRHSLKMRMARFNRMKGQTGAGP